MSGGDSSEGNEGKETIVKAMGVRETGGRFQEGRRWERKLARRRNGKVTC